MPRVGTAGHGWACDGGQFVGQPAAEEEQGEAEGEAWQDVDLRAHAEGVGPAVLEQFGERKMQRVTDRGDAEEATEAARVVDRLGGRLTVLHALREAGDE